MTAEILSIIAVSISSFAALFSATIPAILNYEIKKADRKAKIELENQQKNEVKFEMFYQKHLKILNDFSILYENWKNEPKNNSDILKFINEIAMEFRISISHWLHKFAEQIANYKTGDNLDEEYKRCRQLILNSYGIKISADTPDYLLSEILKVVLKEKFNELQNATSKDFHFHRF